jgi:hypothetical protein
MAYYREQIDVGKHVSSQNRSEALPGSLAIASAAGRAWKRRNQISGKATKPIANKVLFSTPSSLLSTHFDRFAFEPVQTNAKDALQSPWTKLMLRHGTWSAWSLVTTTLPSKPPLSLSG